MLNSIFFITDYRKEIDFAAVGLIQTDHCQLVAGRSVRRFATTSSPPVPAIDYITFDRAGGWQPVNTMPPAA